LASDQKLEYFLLNAITLNNRIFILIDIQVLRKFIQIQGVKKNLTTSIH
jgi:hypothetical protein